MLTETLSAMMDDEASEFELRRAVAAANASPAGQHLQQTWQRYHLIRSSLAQEVHSTLNVNLLAGIHKKLETDTRPVSVPLQRRFSGIMQRLGQGAVAASVAFTVLYGASQMQVAINAGDENLSQQLAETDGLPELFGDFTPSQLSRTVSLDTAARDRLQRAVLQFSGMPMSSSGEIYAFPMNITLQSAPVSDMPAESQQLPEEAGND